MAETYLVTGGAGFIGSHIVKRLLKEGGRVRVVDDLSTGSLTRLQPVLDSIEFEHGDLADGDVCDRVMQGTTFVFHQAAIPSVQRSIKDPAGTNRANIAATVNVLESARRHRVRRVIYAASSSAYGDTEILPKIETMPARPLSPYALQKFVGEQYCKLYYDLYGLETVSLRYFNVFGPAQDPHSEYSAVIPKFISKLLSGGGITIYGDGNQSRDFTYVDNVVHANLLALKAKNAPGKVFNVGCGERTSLNDLVATLEKILVLKATVEYAPARPGDVRHSLADLSLAKSLLGYQPRVTLEEGLKRTVEAMRRI